MNSLPEKSCTFCKETKPLSDYSVSNRFRDGHKPQCKKCLSKAAVAYNQKPENRDKRNARRRQQTADRKANKPILPPPTSKVCSKCGIDKPLDSFSKNTVVKSGLRSSCRQCNSEYRKIRKHQNNQVRNKWVAAHREEVNRKQQVSRKINGHYGQRVRMQRLKQNGLYAITPKEINKIKSQPCFYCGATGKMTLDHVLPIARGGRHSIGNLVPACRKCNSSKNDKTVMEWRLYQMKTILS